MAPRMRFGKPFWPSAVIRAAAEGSETQELLSHYEARLTAGFERHLAQCVQFYTSGHSGRWWDSESRSLQQGLEWCAGKLGDRREFQYRLDGLELYALRR